MVTDDNEEKTMKPYTPMKPLADCCDSLGCFDACEAGHLPQVDEDNPCYDCGSTIPGHHTHNCDLVSPCDKLDLGTQSPNVQWWDGKPPKEG
jgi:hypothetical protein